MEWYELQKDLNEQHFEGAMLEHAAATQEVAE